MSIFCSVVPTAKSIATGASASAMTDVQTESANLKRRYYTWQETQDKQAATDPSPQTLALLSRPPEPSNAKSSSLRKVLKRSSSAESEKGKSVQLQTPTDRKEERWRTALQRRGDGELGEGAERHRQQCSPQRRLGLVLTIAFLFLHELLISVLWRLVPGF